MALQLPAAKAVTQLREIKWDDEDVRFINKGRFGTVFQVKYRGELHALKRVIVDPSQPGNYLLARELALADLMRNRMHFIHANKYVMEPPSFRHNIPEDLLKKSGINFVEENQKRCQVFWLLMPLAQTSLGEQTRMAHHSLKPYRALTLLHRFVWAMQLAAGYSFLHSVLVMHRDIKPNNALLRVTHENQAITAANLSAYITDFGCSSFGARSVERLMKINAEGATESAIVPETTMQDLKDDGTRNLFTGTPGYQAPELIDTSMEYSYSADIFSFGILMYNLFTGCEDDVQALYKHFLVNVHADLPPAATPEDVNERVKQFVKEQLKKRHHKGVRLQQGVQQHWYKQPRWFRIGEPRKVNGATLHPRPWFTEDHGKVLGEDLILLIQSCWAFDRRPDFAFVAARLHKMFIDVMHAAVLRAVHRSKFAQAVEYLETAHDWMHFHVPSLRTQPCRKSCHCREIYSMLQVCRLANHYSNMNRLVRSMHKVPITSKIEDQILPVAPLIDDDNDATSYWQLKSILAAIRCGNRANLLALANQLDIQNSRLHALLSEDSILNC